MKAGASMLPKPPKSTRRAAKIPIRKARGRLACRDYGNLEIADLKPEEALKPISEAVANALGGCDAVVVLGGDNGVTRSAMHGLGTPLERCGLVTLDQHFDLRTLEGGLINGNPVRALLDDGLPGGNIAHSP